MLRENVPRGIHAWRYQLGGIKRRCGRTGAGEVVSARWMEDVTRERTTWNAQVGWYQ